MSFPRSLSEFRSRTLAAVNVVAEHFMGDDLARRNIHNMINYKRRDDIDEDLIRAIRKTDVGAMYNLLNQGANLDSHVDGWRISALNWACCRSREELVTGLLSWGVTVTSDCLEEAINTENRSCFSPINLEVSAFESGLFVLLLNVI